MNLLQRFTHLTTTTCLLIAGAAAPAVAQEACPRCEATTAARATAAAPRSEVVHATDERRARPLAAAHTERRDDLRAALRELVRRARAGDERARAQLERLRAKRDERGGAPWRGGRSDLGPGRGSDGRRGERFGQRFGERPGERLGQRIGERLGERIGARMRERMAERMGERLGEGGRGAGLRGPRDERFDGSRPPRAEHPQPERRRGERRQGGPQGPF